MIAMAAMMSPDSAFHTQRHKMTRRGITGEPLNPQAPTGVLKPFYLQDGIANMIREFYKILAGTSKLGNRKQARILSKIEGYLQSGHLTQVQISIYSPTPLDFEEWVNLTEEVFTATMAETGADRELDYNLETIQEELYSEYLKNFK
jgi:hypothetical protein